MSTDSNTLTLEVTNDLPYPVDNIQPLNTGTIDLPTFMPVQIPFTGTPANIVQPVIELINNHNIPSISVTGDGWTLTEVNNAPEYVITHSNVVSITISLAQCRVLVGGLDKTDVGGGGIAMVGTVSMIVTK